MPGQQTPDRSWKTDRMIGATEVRKRFRAKVEERRKFHFDRQSTSDTISCPWAVLDELLQWLDVEEHYGQA